MYPIGQFSRMCGISVKALRNYHEQGLLIPDHVDEQTGYRYYRSEALERARVIVKLRSMEFSLSEIAVILRDCEEDADMLEYLERQQSVLDAKLKETRRVRDSLSRVVAGIKRARERNLEEIVQEKELEDFLFCGRRGLGPWSGIGADFGRVGRRAGRHMRGPGISLCYDGEYKDEADYEVGFQVKREIVHADLDCRVLAGGPCVSAIHRGGYDSIDRTYEKVFRYIEERGWVARIPTREVYWKGPGMILRGNPDRYVTEIQVLLDGG